VQDAQIIAQCGQTMMPMGAACKSRAMEKVKSHYCSATMRKDFSTPVNNLMSRLCDARLQVRRVRLQRIA
jgi:hypothetical protein